MSNSSSVTACIVNIDEMRMMIPEVVFHVT